MQQLFIFGYGYTAQALARRLIPQGWSVTGTTRNEEKASEMKATGVEPFLWMANASMLTHSRALITF